MSNTPQSLPEGFNVHSLDEGVRIKLADHDEFVEYYHPEGEEPYYAFNWPTGITFDEAKRFLIADGSGVDEIESYGKSYVRVERDDFTAVWTSGGYLAGYPKGFGVLGVVAKIETPLTHTAIQKIFDTTRTWGEVGSDVLLQDFWRTVEGIAA